MRGGQGGEHWHCCFSALGAGVCSADTQEKRIKSKEGVKVKQIRGEKMRGSKSLFSLLPLLQVSATVNWSGLKEFSEWWFCLIIQSSNTQLLSLSSGPGSVFHAGCGMSLNRYLRAPAPVEFTVCRQ